MIAITMKLTIIVLILTFIMFNNVQVQSLKILGVLHTPARSHYYPFDSLVRGLAAKGHELTVISFFGRDKPVHNIEDIILTREGIDKGAKEMFDLIHDTTPSRINGFVFLRKFAYLECEIDLKSQAFRTFLSSNRTFDLLILEAFDNDCYFGLIDKFNVPVVQFTSSAILPMHYERFGQPDNPAYIPSLIAGYSSNMNLWERVQNTIIHLKLIYEYKYGMVPEHYDLAVKVYGPELRPFQEIVKNSTLLIVNAHFTYFGARPNVPGVIEVGGIHIGKAKPLLKNIEKWINESKDGVIYFSMGSMIKGHTFPEDKRKIFLRAFGRLKQRVLWKWENETMPGKPDNVMIQKWMPQFDILSHPNVKAFISHGGLLGTTEAVHCGVPVVVMPQFGDQHTNARALEAGGGGVVLNFREADEEMVYNALKTVLDPEFNKKAKELSARFRDRPMSPMDTAIYWIEYVARHKGAHHMRTAAVGMPLYQYLLLDVFAFLALVGITILIVTIYVTKFFWRLLLSFFSSSNQKTKKVKKN